jgi:hypothetical protein
MTCWAYCAIPKRWLRCCATNWKNSSPTGALSILPQKHAIGYNIGYSGGGPHALAAYLTQVADSDGQNTAAGTEYEVAHPAILAWTQSQAVDRDANELTLDDLKAMQQD